MSRTQEMGERIKTMRMSRGMTQLDLANALHCGQSTVAMWESGAREPNFATIDYMSDIFNVPPYAIMYSEAEIEEQLNGQSNLTLDERRLLAAYRAAEPSFQKAAIQLLEFNPAVQEKENRA